MTNLRRAVATIFYFGVSFVLSPVLCYLGGERGARIADIIMDQGLDLIGSDLG